MPGRAPIEEQRFLKKIIKMKPGKKQRQRDREKYKEKKRDVEKEKGRQRKIKEG